MKKIKNANYRQFLDEGEINILKERHIRKALKNIKGKHVAEGRALLIALYYTGARPIEILKVKAGDISRKDSYIIIKIMGAKKGLSRSIYLKYDLELARELYQYSTRFPESYILFFHFRNNYKRVYKNKKGEIKHRIEITDKLRYYIYKWFEGVIDHSIPPYFLRHNRFSALIMDPKIEAEDIRVLKGAKNMSSVFPYLHMSGKTAQKLAKSIQ